MINVEVIPKELQKPLIYGALIGVGLVAFSIYRNGVSGTAEGIASGIVKGVGGAVVGTIGGIVTGTGEVIADGYSALPNAIKPSSDQNIIYKSVNKIGAGVTGDSSFTLGGWLYDITH